MMKNTIKIIIVFEILIVLILQCHKSYAGEKLINIKTSDSWNVVYISGSMFGTLAIQKLYKCQWYKAALTMFSLALIKETSDELFKRYGNGIEHPVLDRRGGDKKDLIRAAIGIAISCPLKYTFKNKLQLVYSLNRIKLNYRF